MTNIELNEKKIWINKEWRKTLEIWWSSRILQLRWTLNLLPLVLLSFSVSKIFFVVPVLFSRPNCVLFIEHNVWPNFGGISEPFTLGKRRRSAWRALADRSADKPWSIGAHAVSGIVGSRSIGLNATIYRRSLCVSCVVQPIDRLV